MAINQTINSIKEHLTNAYNKAEEKGAVIPENKNIQNLESTIDSIQVGGGSIQDESIIIQSNGTTICPTGIRYNPIVVNITGDITSNEVGNLIRMMDMTNAFTSRFYYITEEDYTNENVEIMLALLEQVVGG